MRGRVTWAAVSCTTVDVSSWVFSLACAATARAANVGFGEHTISSTAERMVLSVSDGESVKRPRQRREVEGADQHADG